MTKTGTVDLQGFQDTKIRYLENNPEESMEEGFVLEGIQFSKDDFMQAGNRSYMMAMPAEKRAALIRNMRGANPRCCAECIFYYHVFDKDRKYVICGGCSIDDDVMIMDQSEREYHCPL